MISSSTLTTPSRSLERMSSAKWAIPSRVVKPKKPDVPLMVWMVRKMERMSSALSGSSSSSTNCWSSISRFSLDSERKSLRMSSSIPMALLLLFPRLYPSFLQQVALPKLTLFMVGGSPTGVSVAPRKR